MCGNVPRRNQDYSILIRLAERHLAIRHGQRLKLLMLTARDRSRHPLRLTRELPAEAAPSPLVDQPVQPAVVPGDVPRWGSAGHDQGAHDMRAAITPRAWP